MMHLHKILPTAMAGFVSVVGAQTSDCRNKPVPAGTKPCTVENG